MNLYSSTLRSLVSDAEAIRQISDMADLVQQGDDAVAEDLIQLDNMVSRFEHKVAVLRQILNEEKNALIQFETNLRDEADDQKALVEGLMAALQLKENDENQQQQIELQQLQIQQQEEVEKESEPAETSLSFSSLGSSTIHNSYRQSLVSAQHGYDLEGDSWDEDNLPHQPSQTQPLARSSTESNGSGSITIKSNESGSFTRRNGLLKSTRFSNNANSNSNANASPHSSSSRPSITKGSTVRKRTVNFASDTNHSHSGRSNNRSYTRDQENTPSQQSHRPDKPMFVPLTDQELGNQKVYGPHMCRYDINDALEEIQTIVWNQMQLAETTSSRRSSNSIGRQQTRYNDTNTSNSSSSSHHRYSVSEQELRENCAFFRHGESTARATLQLLCTLKRLKQVPSKKSQVTYICLFGV